MEKFDLIIIGGGPAGLTAGIFAARRALKVLILAKSLGGQANLARIVENYPGFSRIKGINLMKKFVEQALKAGAQIRMEEVKKIEEAKKNFYCVKTNFSNYFAKAIILAYGKTPRSLKVKGEKEFVGKGVSYCASCDLPLFKNKKVAIVGGGNSALDAAIYASKICKKVYLIHRRSEFRAFEYLVEKVKKMKNVEILMKSKVIEIKGNERVKSILVKNGKIREIKVDGVFIEIGHEAKIDLVKNLVKTRKNHIIIDNLCRTFYPNSNKIRPGIFAAGDITITPFKQIVVAASEGCKAALQAYNYLVQTKRSE